MKTKSKYQQTPDKHRNLSTIDKKSFTGGFLPPTEQFSGYVSSALSKIREEFRSLPNIRKIASRLEGNLLRIWTFVDDYSITALKPIYKKELEIVDQFPDLIFHFNTIFDPDEDAPINAEVVYSDKCSR
ncbi:MAG: hypothetical protein HQK89_16720 [Nitrospirae bacterium]|nr:hypothetical protein [Nitrospirota bacterium]